MDVPCLILPPHTLIAKKKKKSESVSRSVVLTLCDPHGATMWPPRDHQAPLSVDFSRQEYWSWYPFSSPGDIPNSGIEPRSPTLQVDSLPSEPPGKPINCKPNVIKLYFLESKSFIDTLKESEEGLEKLSFGVFLFWLIFYIEMVRLTLWGNIKM